MHIFRFRESITSIHLAISNLAVLITNIRKLRGFGCEQKISERLARDELDKLEMQVKRLQEEITNQRDRLDGRPIKSNMDELP
jgi:hypothetical protein